MAALRGEVGWSEGKYGRGRGWELSRGRERGIDKEWEGDMVGMSVREKEERLKNEEG